MQLTGDVSSLISFGLAQRRRQSSRLPAQQGYGRVSDEDRRWWIVHLDCCPDVTPGTFHSWLDGCGEHTAKKLVERNVWTIEQVAGMSSDEIDELRFKEGCGHMDVVWEHARTIIHPLRSRVKQSTGEGSLQSKIIEIRKKRELQRRKEIIIDEKQAQTTQREETLRKLRDAVAKKKEALRLAQQHRQANFESNQQKKIGSSDAKE